MDAIAAALPEHLGKAAVNEWVGSIQIEPYRYVVHTGTRSDPPLTHGPCLLKEAPGGYVDWCQRQEVRGVTSMRCIWQSILDQELALLAQLSWHLRRAGVVVRGFKQFRVDAILCQADRKHATKSSPSRH